MFRPTAQTLAALLATTPLLAQTPAPTESAIRIADPDISQLLCLIEFRLDPELNQTDSMAVADRPAEPVRRRERSSGTE